MANEQRIVLLAMRTLEDALAQARLGPVVPHWGHQLALTVLERKGIGLAWQYDAFRKAMLDRFEGAWHPSHAVYLRTTHLTGLLNYWWRALGHPPPSHQKRGAWADAAAAVKERSCNS